MPAAEPHLPSKPLCLVFGDEDFLVRDRARQVYDGWCAEVGGVAGRAVDDLVILAAEALDALARPKAKKLTPAPP